MDTPLAAHEHLVILTTDELAYIQAGVALLRDQQVQRRNQTGEDRWYQRSRVGDRVLGTLFAQVGHIEPDAMALPGGLALADPSGAPGPLAVSNPAADPGAARREREMDVESPPGTRIVFRRPDAGYPGDQARVAKHLTLGATYTIDRMLVESWHTTVFLVEVPHVGFNSVHFVAAR